MIMGLVMVKFNDEASRDQVLEETGNVRPWTTNLNAVKMIHSVPLWIRIYYDLGLQYLGNRSLSALVSTIGKPIIVDQHTKERTRIQFARVLVEMEITDDPPRFIRFLNEHAQLMEQNIDYKWLPVKCKSCFNYKHTMAECRKCENKKEKGEGLKKAEIKEKKTSNC
ncbi:hypothetical protein F8388_004594 [Cannabis sativa]|uniref:DUF4283 domain-containing protein n=1 Tax=Cannabis sativa TaxID=3483 RepID=A0A7J6GND7_CANSA|nr:hypothetical protein F8388_004594 [Cannabis sativa]